MRTKDALVVPASAKKRRHSCKPRIMILKNTSYLIVALPLLRSLFLFPKKGKPLIYEFNAFYGNAVKFSPLFSVGFGTGIYKMRFVVNIDNFVLPP